MNQKSNHHNPIFLVAVEEKDDACLKPFQHHLKACLDTVKFCNIFDEITKPNCGVLGELLLTPHPIVITAYVEASRIIRALRASGSFTSIEVDHGIAPFKRYSWSEFLLESDYYLAPTELLRARLAALYPEQNHKILLGGYPKIGELGKRINQELSQAQIEAAGIGIWISEAARHLVILSWGVRAETLRSLPDYPSIIYLIHPADARLLAEKLLINAQIVVSDPLYTGELIGTATHLYGDHSSLTLEISALDVPVYLFLIRDLYCENYDVNDEFFDHSSPNFASVPYSHIKFPQQEVMNCDDLRAALSGESTKIMHLTLPSEMRPAPNADTRLVHTIQEIAGRTYKSGQYDQSRVQITVDCCKVILSLYRNILRRNPDPMGFLHYFDRLAGSGFTETASGECIASVIAEIANSPEGKNVREG